MTSQSDLIVRFAEPADCAALFDLVQGLAEYENLSHAVTGSSSTLKEHLFGSPKYPEAILTQVAS
jgi:hypothetical protein